jgi:hypothetical protein
VSKTNIFGLLREEVTVAGIPLLKRQSLTPAERVWLQENSEAARNEWNVAYLAFVDAVKDKLKYKTQEEAYHAVKEYFRGTLDAIESDKIELLSIASPLKRDRDIDEQELTYLLNSRIIKDKFPAAEFSEAFGIEYANTWTIDHTKAIAEIHPELNEFFASESEGKKSDSAAVTGK